MNHTPDSPSTYLTPAEEADLARRRALVLFLLTPEALDLSDAEIGERIGLNRSVVYQAWKDHFAALDQVDPDDHVLPPPRQVRRVQAFYRLQRYLRSKGIYPNTSYHNHETYR